MIRSPEQQLIQELLAPLAKDVPGAFGLRDDAALVQCGAKNDLVVTTDTVVEAVHFLPDDPPDVVARKALRVNLSDLAAKGAEPAGYLLSLALPQRCDRGWIEKFVDGLASDQSRYGCHLLGGDTVHTDGPVVVTITATGTVPEGGMKRRGGARPGELIYVTGTIGDAFLGLKARSGDAFSGALSDEEIRYLSERYRVPEPRVDFVKAVRNYASAAMDVSDGLAGDLELMCDASGVTAQVDLTQVALSGPARKLLDAGLVSLPDLMSGGDDYELLITVPANSVYALEGAARRLSASVSRIGRVEAGNGTPVFFGPAGEIVEFEQASYSHFDE